MQTWAKADPADFVATAVAELDGTTARRRTAPPYNHAADAGQMLGRSRSRSWAGVRHPGRHGQDFVLEPLRTAQRPTRAAAALAHVNGAPAASSRRGPRRTPSPGKAPDGDPAQVASRRLRPGAGARGRLLHLAQSGGAGRAAHVDGGSFYAADYTKPLLFLADGTYLEAGAVAQHLGGDQWGMMNETGNYPGQAWLWLYTFWYQIKPFSTSANADAHVWGLMMAPDAAAVLVPFIPGLRSIPRWIPVHRLIWRDYYRAGKRRREVVEFPGAGPGPGVGGEDSSRVSVGGGRSCSSTTRCDGVDDPEERQPAGEERLPRTPRWRR